MGIPRSTLPTESAELTVEGASGEPGPSGQAPPGWDWTRFRRLATAPAAIAVITWLIATPVAFGLPRLINLDPFSQRAAFLPLGAGGVLLIVVTTVAWRRRASERVPACAAGLLAAWVAFAFRVALNGTPHGSTGLQGDRVRVAAAATRYTITPWPADAFIEGLPSEYPPLFPWLVGRGSLLLDVPAWRLLAFAEVLLLSFAVLAAFLMWRRLVPAAVALAISGAGLLVYGDPRKAFAVITLFVFVPWLIATFAEPPRGRLHWLPAGVIGGLIMLTYIGWFPFGVLGVLAVIGLAWRRSADRARYVRHVLLVGAVAAVVAAPYLIPWGAASLTKGGQALGDMFVSEGLTAHSFPFLEPTLFGAVQLVGLAGLVWYRTRAWWAAPLIYLVLGSYLFWLIMGIRFVFTEHTTLFYYVPLLTSTALLAAGVLTLATAAPALARRLSVTPPYRSGALATAAMLLWVGFTYWQNWLPVTAPGDLNNTDLSNRQYTSAAHREPLPDCGYSRFAPEKGRFACYPVNQIKAEVERVRGVGARPQTLASDERLYAYLPWPGYMGMDRTSATTLARWDDRFDEAVRLSQISDPTEFARATAATRFGPIDTFVLYQFDRDTWSGIYLRFHPSQFDPTVWTVVKGLPDNTVLVIRNP